MWNTLNILETSANTITKEVTNELIDWIIKVL